MGLEDFVKRSFKDFCKVVGLVFPLAISSSYAESSVRVLLKQDVSTTTISTPAKNSRTVIDRSDKGVRISCPDSEKKVVYDFALPCTLSYPKGQVMNVEDKPYRGKLIIIPSNDSKRFSVINYLGVEDYLKGVVPAEIGALTEKELEAAKAQAVAARTYTFKRMKDRGNESFDLLPTVQDQVYDGFKAESELCNKAIEQTKDLVIVHDDTLIDAYYHSTCAGRTANIEDVWDKDAKPYLKSVSDLDNVGKAFCSGSARFSWSEKWSTSVLSSIVNKYSKETKSGKSCDGNIQNIGVKSRFGCDRIEDLEILTSKGTCDYRGDEIRFVLRRDQGGNPILYSSNFSVVSVDPSFVKVEGKGFGHGVGMCQTGAIGRARQGQSFEDILDTYYTGVKLKKM